MTSSEPMTREDLLELAALDAFGLLDEYESSLYTRCFHHAPVTVQEEIIKLQAELAGDEALLPDETVPDNLRGRVVAAVNRAIEEENAHLAPIASIGSRTAAHLAAPLHRADGRRPAGSRLSIHLWRAAAFVLAGATIVGAYFLIHLVETNDQITGYLIGKRTEEAVLEHVGTEFTDFVNHPGARLRVLAPVDNESLAVANLYHNLESGESFLMAMALPEDQDSFVLRGLDAAGNVEFEHAFRRTDVIMGAQVHLTGLTSTLFATMRWEITAASSDLVVARTG